MTSSPTFRFCISATAMAFISAARWRIIGSRWASTVRSSGKFRIGSVAGGGVEAPAPAALVPAGGAGSSLSQPANESKLSTNAASSGIRMARRVFAPPAKDHGAGEVWGHRSMRRSRRNQARDLAVAAAEDEIHRPKQAEARPQEIPFQGLTHVEQGEGHEDRKRDHFLHDLELRKRQVAIADPVGGHLQQV